MAKRSPILGYNHNVLYRGLIFHVQTEDSGLMSPHLFTHLFYSGVIISSRKLVYDAGSDEGAIKALMQSQHKAVMKDLKRHTFDDKIDVYLAGTPGLLPRDAPAAAAEDAPAAPVPAATASAVPAPYEARAEGTEPIAAPAEIAAALEAFAPMDVRETPAPPAPAPRAMTPAMPAVPSTMTPMPMPAVSRTATPPPIPMAAKQRADTDVDAPSALAPPRTQTAARVGRPPGPPPPDELDPPTVNDTTAASIAAAIAAANAHTLSRDFQVDSSPEIEIQLELDDPDEPGDEARSRRARDTAVEMPNELGMQSDGIPGLVGAAASSRVPQESIPPLPAPPGSRPSSVGAAALPPRTVTRTPGRAITSSGIVSRPLPIDDRARHESDAVEVYAAPPPSADAPPGLGDRMGERPGVYSQHRRPTRAPGDVRERSGSIPIPAGLGRPGRVSQGPMPASTATPASGVPRPVAPQVTEPLNARTATASRAATPTASRTSSTSSGGVVMTRPAVIVGAPAKTTAPMQRIRKAREDEGRGFGQGLISEKSLDEVILAYLSEDADDK